MKKSNLKQSEGALTDNTMDLGESNRATPAPKKKKPIINVRVNDKPFQPDMLRKNMLADLGSTDSIRKVPSGSQIRANSELPAV